MALDSRFDTRLSADLLSFSVKCANVCQQILDTRVAVQRNVRGRDRVVIQHKQNLEQRRDTSSETSSQVLNTSYFYMVYTHTVS